MKQLLTLLSVLALAGLLASCSLKEELDEDDLLPPNLTLSGFASGATLPLATNLNILAADSDGEVEQIDIVLDGATSLYSNTFSAATVTVTFEIEPGNYTAGTHTLTVTATDAAGHTTTGTIDFKIDLIV